MGLSMPSDQGAVLLAVHATANADHDVSPPAADCRRAARSDQGLARSRRYPDPSGRPDGFAIHAPGRATIQKPPVSAA